MKECSKCHRKFEDSAAYCPECGGLLVGYTEQYNMTEKISYKEYIKNHLDDDLKKSVLVPFWIWIGLAVFNIVVALISETLGSVILDVVIVTALAFWWKASASKASAIVGLIYSILNVVIMSYSLEQLAGWYFIIPAINAMVAAKKLTERYNQFINGR